MSRDSSWRHDEDKGCHLDGPNLTEIPFSTHCFCVKEVVWFLCGPQAGERKREISALGNDGGKVSPRKSKMARRSESTGKAPCESGF